MSSSEPTSAQGLDDLEALAKGAFASGHETVAISTVRLLYLISRVRLLDALRISLARADAAARRGVADTERIDFMESLTGSVDQHFCPPGNHGGDPENWLLTLEDDSTPSPHYREYEAITVRDLLDAARAHPEDTTDAN